MTKKSCVAAFLVLMAGWASSDADAQTRPAVPAGGDPAMACGQKPDGRAYWTEYAYCDLPVRGPGNAKGLVFWSHGVSGNLEQYTAPVSPVMRRLASDGWDVVRINRNNLYERCSGGGGNGISQCWLNSGVRHVADLIERTHRAKAQGYDKVVTAGQSFGGAISAEANVKAPGLFHAVVAFSPGHGSDAGSGSTAAYYNLDRQMLDVLAQERTGRVIVSFPPGDALHPNRYNDPIGPKARATLQAGGLPFVVFDQTSPINGHGAARTNQFDAWYGNCIRDFLDTARSPAAGETKCPPPSPVPKFLLPANIVRAAPGSEGSARWLGAWEGSYADPARELSIVVEKIDGTTATLIYAVGAGPNRDLSMGFDRYTNGKIEGNKLTVDRGDGRQLLLTMAADGQRVDVQHRAPPSTLSGLASRAN